LILTREIKLRINESNLHHYENMGYEISIGEEITIPVELLTKGSHKKILCKCDSCSIEKEVIFKNYVKYGNVWGEYFCRKCSEEKRKKSLMDNMGVEYPIQNKGVYKKIKQTLLENKKKYERYKRLRKSL
jgi:hypothetical protein